MSVAWVLTRCYGIFALHGAFPYQRAITSDQDVRLYWMWAFGFWHGAMPYVGGFPTPLLYPPGMLPVLGLPPYSLGAYRVEFLVIALLVDLLVFRALLRAGRSKGALVWVAAAPLLGPIFWSRLDIFVAAMLVAAVLAFERRRYALASFWLTWAALIKLWPLLLLVVVLRLVPPERRRGFVTASALPLAAALGPLIAGGGWNGLRYVVTVQTGRGVEVESLFALPLYIFRALGHSVPIVLGASWQFTGNADWWVAGISTLCLGVAAAFCVVRGILRPPAGWGIAEWLLVVVLAVLMTDRVLSPQYLVWTAAAVAMMADQTQRWRELCVATGVVLVATQLQFPFGFDQLVLGTGLALPLSALHAGALVTFGVVGVRAVRRPSVSVPSGPNGVGTVRDAAPAGLPELQVPGISADELHPEPEAVPFGVLG